MSVKRLGTSVVLALGLGLGLGDSLTSLASAQDIHSPATRRSLKTVERRQNVEADDELDEYHRATADIVEEYAPTTRAVAAKATPVPRKNARAGAPSYQSAAPHEDTFDRQRPAERQVAYERVQPAGYARRNVVDDPTMYETMGDGGCATCGGGDCGGSCGGLSDCVPCNYFARNGWYIGADYTYSRANFSEPVSSVVRVVSTDANGNNTFTDSNQTYDLNYQSNFRVNGGYRWGTCGEAINFSYTGFQDNTTYFAPIPVAGSVVVAGPMAINCSPGDRLITSLNISANNYDLDYSKRIPICTQGSDECGCPGGCPPWALTWSAGLRYGDVSLNSPTTLFDATGALVTSSNASVEFQGIGPKIGLEGRRYLGCNQRWSVYGKGSLSLLVGQYDVALRSVIPGPPDAIAMQNYNYTRMVPVTDIEIGISRQIGAKTMVTAGYFAQCWWDVSTLNTVDASGVGIINTPNLDDANIMAFDGFMFRIERVF
ncbi:MAG: Lpg1974 family pore-forming outer membrane protein [Pirellulales bacterium]